MCEIGREKVGKRECQRVNGVNESEKKMYEETY